MAYFDLQLNGYAGVDFNGDSLNRASLEMVCQRLESQGVGGILATVITDSIGVMEARLGRIATLLEDHPKLQRIIKGIHVEGPFINPNPGYRGAHPDDAIIPADGALMERLLAAGRGFIRLVTLAPEFDSGLKVTRLLSDMGIVVSAGHSDASLDQLLAAIDNGLTMFTHVGNGCPASMPRHDNIIQRVLSLRGRLWLCFIADGVHIPFFVLSNYLDLVGLEKTIVVTDGIAASDLGPGRYRFGRWELNIGDDLIARSPDSSHLLGSTVTMPRTFHNLTEILGLSAAAARMLVEDNPHRALANAFKDDPVPSPASE
jgi:N-acetylglucosamine-6-phosphate deacetylase